MLKTGPTFSPHAPEYPDRPEASAGRDDEPCGFASLLAAVAAHPVPTAPLSPLASPLISAGKSQTENTSFLLETIQATAPTQTFNIAYAAGALGVSLPGLTTGAAATANDADALFELPTSFTSEFAPSLELFDPSALGLAPSPPSTFVPPSAGVFFDAGELQNFWNVEANGELPVAADITNAASGQMLLISDVLGEIDSTAHESPSQPLLKSVLETVSAGPAESERPERGEIGEAPSALLSTDTRHEPQTLGTKAAAPALPLNETSLAKLVATLTDLPRGLARSLRLRLHPEELGDVQITLTSDAAGRVSARFAAPRDEARDALAAGLSHLRAALERAGVHIDRLDVGLNFDSHSAPHQQPQHGAPGDQTRPAPPLVPHALTLNTTAGGEAATVTVASNLRLLTIRA